MVYTTTHQLMLNHGLKFKDVTLYDGAQEVPDKVTSSEPFDPILMITHLVLDPRLSSSCPANIGLPMPVNDSA